MSESIKKRLQAVSSNKDSKELQFLLTSILTDLTALKTTVDAGVVDITALDTSIDTLIGKMNSDGGITDTDYAGAAAMTASASDTLTLVD